MQPKKIFASLVMRNLSTFVTVVCPPSHKKKKKNMQQKQGGKTNTTATTTTTTSSSKFNTNNTNTIMVRPRANNAHLFKKARLVLWGVSSSRGVFFLARLRVRRVLRTEKKNVSFLLLRANVFFCFGISEPPLCNKRQDDRRGGRFGGRFGRRV